MTRHIHADLIHAWADGAEIQWQEEDGTWYDLEKPTWGCSCQYRIKPRKVKREGWVNICVTTNMEKRWIGATVFDSQHQAECNKPERWICSAKIEWEEER